MFDQSWLSQYNKNIVMIIFMLNISNEVVAMQESKYIEDSY